jgi:hypothetical protein
MTLARQSYGGFMSSKVVEAGAGIHSLAMAVAVSSLGFSMGFLLILACPAGHQLAFIWQANAFD